MVRSALNSLSDDYGYEVAAAVFIGGAEKISDAAEFALDMPLYRGETPERALIAAIDEVSPVAVIDLSDEPVLDYVKRFRLASFALSRGVAYIGADFRFDPPDLPDLLSKPSLGIIGTGKRIGKTAVSGFACRVLSASGFSPAVIAMGRGGPSIPESLLGGKIELTPEGLLAFAEKGKHAASDYFEDALTSRITTVGCRRCGGGLAGAPFFSNVPAGARIANALEESFIVAEGSGSALPPVKVDAYLLTVGAVQPEEYAVGYFGTYRALLADVAVITMCEEPFADGTKIESLYRRLKEIKSDLKVVKTVFRPKPLGKIDKKRVFVATTASPEAEPAFRSRLEGMGAEVVGMSFSLSDRQKLARDLEEASAAEVLLTELKAAAVDVATRKALEMGLEIVYLDNEPVSVGGDGDLAELIVELADVAVERFSI